MVRFLQRGIRHAQFTVEFGQTSRDRDAAKLWIMEANAVIRGIREAGAVIRGLDRPHEGDA